MRRHTSCLTFVNRNSAVMAHDAKPISPIIRLAYKYTQKPHRIRNSYRAQAFFYIYIPPPPPKFVLPHPRTQDVNIFLNHISLYSAHFSLVCFRYTYTHSFSIRNTKSASHQIARPVCLVGCWPGALSAWSVGHRVYR